MLKMNNKGFAITTMLYGLLIIVVLVMFLLLSIMSFNKKSQTDFVNKLDQELNTLANSKRTTCAP